MGVVLWVYLFPVFIPMEYWITAQVDRPIALWVYVIRGAESQTRNIRLLGVLYLYSYISLGIIIHDIVACSTT
jgi:hypothetical protein